jgi:hypothetical protein
MESQQPDGPAEGASPQSPALGPEVPTSPVPAAGVGTIRPGDGPPSPDYPVRLEFDRQERYSRLLIFVKWLLAIPHFIVLLFVFVGVFLALIAAFFAVLFTGRYPTGIFNFVLGASRWCYRVVGYVMLLTDDYPPFSFDDDPNYPVRLAIAQPERIANWRPLVHWLLVIPYSILAQLLGAIWLYLISWISWFAILFTGKYPQVLFDFTVVAQRWNVRAGAYTIFMTERYPPFAYA